jgi:hypothetical protein
VVVLEVAVTVVVLRDQVAVVRQKHQEPLIQEVAVAAIIMERFLVLAVQVLLSLVMGTLLQNQFQLQDHQQLH